MSQWNDGNIDCNGVSVHFYRTGSSDKPNLILSHGFTDNGLCWSRTARALEDRFDIIMVDARNHGLSGAGPAQIETLADDLATIIKTLDLAPVTAIGHSVGGYAVAGLSAYHGQLVSQMILEDPPWQLVSSQASPSREQGFRDYVEMMADLSTAEAVAHGKSLHPNWHEDEFEPWVQSNKQVSFNAMSLLNLGDWQELLPHIQVPGLLLYADGGMVNSAVVKLVQELNKGIEACKVADAGHNLRRENFAGFLQAIEEFMQSHNTSENC